MKFYREHFLAGDAAIAVVLSCAVLAWMIKFCGIATVDCILAGNRSAVYGALSTIFGSLLGFAITAVSIIVGVWGLDRLTILRESKHAGDLWRIFTSTTRWLGLATVLSLAGLIGDRDAEPVHSILYATVVVTAIAVTRLGRSIWSLENIVRILAAPKPKPRGVRRRALVPGVKRCASESNQGALNPRS
jgi:hypothetical protein